MLRTKWIFSLILVGVWACVPQNQPEREGELRPIDEGAAKGPSQPSALLFPSQVYWGDTHLHTSDSADAFAYGARLGPEQALRFARGEEVTSTMGLVAQLERPLDFLVIADHAVALGVTQQIYSGNPTLLGDPTLNRWNKMMNADLTESQKATRELIDGHSAGTNPDIMSDAEVMQPIMQSVWHARGLLVDHYNEPGRFTAFHGYEYTPTPSGDNLHRVVIFRDGADKTNQIYPFSSSDSLNPEDLWDALAAYEKTYDGRVLAIPHNSNLSNGRMFAFSDFEGNPIDAEYAEKSSRWEPLIEITQFKGDSESHPFLSPNDEFAAFGDRGWDRGNLNLSGRKTTDMLGGDYVREALKRGLQLELSTGVNPFKYGFIGSTDAHTGLATADSDNYFGKNTGLEPGPHRVTPSGDLGSKRLRLNWHYLASGYAAVWAKENTREALFDAMIRKEVYATTGPRITLRLFGGWDFDEADITASNMVERGYTQGVPMGSDLPTKTGATPTFLLSAQMDPDGANLDRLQIVKGWVNETGETEEKVYDVAWSDAREFGEDGKLPAVGDTVDLNVPTWTNTIGTQELKAAWSDPDFDVEQAAFYYVRAIEIPTPRWVAYDAVRYGVELIDEISAKHQERAYSSPIWYNPPN